MANSKGIPSASGGGQNGTSRTVIVAAACIVVVYGVAVTLVAIFAPASAALVIPLLLASLGPTIPALLALVRVGEVAKAVDGMTSELVEAKTGKATAEATLVEKGVQEARAAEIASASATKSTTTTTTTTDSSKVAVEPLPAVGLPVAEPPKEGG